MSTALFQDLPIHRRKELSSATAHFITGVLDGKDFTRMVEVLVNTVQLQKGDRVKTLRGSTKGVVLRMLEDGRIIWKPDGAKSELMTPPENLLSDSSNR